LNPLLRLGLIVAAVLAALDQITKWLMLTVVFPGSSLESPLGPEPIPVTPFFNIVLVWNRGASFGLFSSHSPWTPVLLSGIALIIVGVLVYWLWKAQSRFLAISIGFVIGGAIGNVIDRAVHGAVVDFLDFYLPATQLPHWPAFNLADIGIFVGAVLILVDGLFEQREKPM
jgi:signal peptidase II